MKDLKKNNISNVKVSVICLAYNHEKYIRRTLEGFAMQKTDFLYEVLIHDDCSTDHTIDIIREFESKYPDIFRVYCEYENQYSKGINNILGIVIPKVRGEYIAFCEGDDYWNDEKKLQRQFRALEEHPECSMAVHKVQCCNEDGSPNEWTIPDSDYNIHGTHILDEDELVQCLWIRGGYPFHTSSYFIRRNVFEVDCAYPRDVGMLRKSLLCGFTYYIDEAMSTRRLWSIGNWNSRMKASGVKGNVIFWEGEVENEMQFDMDTGYKYHSAILLSCLRYIINLSRYDSYKAKELLNKYQSDLNQIQNIISKELRIGQKVRCFLVKYFPGSVRIYNWFWKMRHN